MTLKHLGLLLFLFFSSLKAATWKKATLLPPEKSESELKLIFQLMKNHYLQKEKLDPLFFLEEGLKKTLQEEDIEIQLENQLHVQKNLQNKEVQLCDNRFCPPPSQPLLGLKASSKPATFFRLQSRLYYSPQTLTWDKLHEIIPSVLKNISSKPLSLASFLNHALSAYDPHSSYLSSQEYTELKLSTEGQFQGIGVLLKKNTTFAIVQTVLPQSSAALQDIQPGDILLSLNQEPLIFTSPEKVSRAFEKAKKNPLAILEIFRPSTSQILEKKLSRNTFPQETLWSTSFLKDKPYLYLYISHFSEKTSSEIIEKWLQFSSEHNPEGLIIDLRDNPGGLLDAAIQVADLFINQGNLVQIYTPNLLEYEKASKYSIIKDIPIVVLINSGTASAAEILAGALKDHHKAILIGETTYGKGSVQSLFETHTGSALKLTVAQYLTPSSLSIQGEGISPHIELQIYSPFGKKSFWQLSPSEQEKEQQLPFHLEKPNLSKNQSKTKPYSLKLSRPPYATLSPDILETFPSSYYAFEEQNLILDPYIKTALQLLNLPSLSSLSEKEIASLQQKETLFSQKQSLKALQLTSQEGFRGKIESFENQIPPENVAFFKQNFSFYYQSPIELEEEFQNNVLINTKKYKKNPFEKEIKIKFISNNSNESKYQIELTSSKNLKYLKLISFTNENTNFNQTISSQNNIFPITLPKTKASGYIGGILLDENQQFLGQWLFFKLKNGIIIPHKDMISLSQKLP